MHLAPAALNHGESGSSPTPAGPALRRRWVVGVMAGLAIVVTASLSIGVVVAAIDDVLLEDLRNYLRRTAETTAAQIDGDRHQRFADSSQTGTPDYLAASAPLAALLRTNPDIRFAYTSVIRGDSAYFILDGERSADRAYVMQADVPTPGEIELQRLHQTVVERVPTPTAWGAGIRAYAPLGGSAGRAGAYVGITMSAGLYHNWMKRVYYAAALGFVVALGLAFVVGASTARVEGSRLRAEAELAQARHMAAVTADERRTMEARLQSRQKLEALGTLAGGVAHDFNNMLTVILGNAELMLAVEPPGSESATSAEAIRTAATQARDVVRRILMYARPEAQTRAPVTLGPVVDETLHLLEATMPSSINLVWQPPEQSVMTFGDASQLTQALMNLGVNASQALSEGRGTIEFRLDKIEIAAGDAGALGLAPGAWARIVVRDDGMGMSDEVRARIFEPFFTTKAVGTGSGLGLSVVDGVVRAHGGVIRVESAESQGTTVTVYLPARDYQDAVVGAMAAPLQAGPTDEYRGTGRRILLLDDDPMVLTVTSRVLRRAGYDIDARVDADDALAALAANPCGYDALVTDRAMPTISGLEVAARARLINAHLPVVMLTGRSEPGDAESPHVAALVAKPADARTLLSAIERVMGKGADNGA